MKTSKNLINKIKKINTINFRPKKPRTSKYLHIQEQMAKLKKNQCFEITIPHDVPAATYIKRLNAFLSTQIRFVRANCKYKKRVTTNGNVAVCCVERK
jgi:hypothetical protein